MRVQLVLSLCTGARAPLSFFGFLALPSAAVVFRFLGSALALGAFGSFGAFTAFGLASFFALACARVSHTCHRCQPCKRSSWFQHTQFRTYLYLLLCPSSALARTTATRPSDPS